MTAVLEPARAMFRGLIVERIMALEVYRKLVRHGKNPQIEVAKIAEYCCYDVKVTKCVHEYGVEHGHVKYHDRNGREQIAKVDWKKL